MLRIRNSLQRLEGSIKKYFSSLSVVISQESIRNIGILAHIDAGNSSELMKQLLESGFFQAKLQQQSECFSTQERREASAKFTTEQQSQIS